MPATVLSVGEDPQLLSLREAVLRSAGFEVLTSGELNSALSHIDVSCPAVLLMCYSMSLSDRRTLARRFRERCPTGRIIGITNMPQTRPPIDADAFLYGIEGAEPLIETVCNQLAQEGDGKKPSDAVTDPIKFTKKRAE